MRSHVISVALLGLVALPTCAQPPRPTAPAGRLQIDVAPLELPGVTDADYTVTVTNAAAGGGDVVWTRALTSSAYGDSAGSLSYVGPCDADAGVNTITLTLTELRDAGGPISLDTYLNPTPVALEALCLPNADVSVRFDLTIARSASQGFFDVAVAFNDVFCSAKLDCGPTTAPADDRLLLLDPATGARATTAVLGLACTGTLSGSTWLYMDDPVITCAGLAPATLTLPAATLGNVDLAAPGQTNPGGYLFAAAVYRGVEGLANKAYWNIALGLDRDAFATAGACTLSARATASDAPFTQLPGGFALPTGAVYPVIDWTVPLSSATGRVCTEHAVNAPSSGVATTYVGHLPAPNQFNWSPTPILLRHRFDAAALAVRTACDATCPLDACGADGVCANPTCVDGRTNGDETGLDCGGPDCPACPSGAPCLAAGDCQSGVCAGLLCAVPSCTDGVANGDETAEDCGGPGCPTCADGAACLAAGDCQSGVCTGLLCAVPSCTDGATNGDETSTDCGGPGCPACADGAACLAAGDCQSGVCAGSLCAVPSCTDGVTNGDETDEDCGGPGCPACADGAACLAAEDCESGVCAGSTCAAPSCTDGVTNGDETASDCGGPDCPGCLTGAPCATVTDCATGFCTPAAVGGCAAATCTAGTPDAQGAVRTCVIDGALYEVRTFPVVGVSSFVTPAGVTSVEVLIVAGGGGAGGSAYALGGGGGGGAGGLLHLVSQPVTPGQSYAVSVGAGGAGGNAGTGGNGGNSSAFGATSFGGGGGGSGNTGGTPNTGGSGGGAGYNGYNYRAGAAGTAGQGHAGGANICSNYAAGGGGAGGVGQDQVSSNCGVGGGRLVNGGLGGPGLTSAISGVARVYAKGGDGSIDAPTDDDDGPPQTGYGGNGTYAAGTGGRGGAGGSGVVLVRFAVP